MIGICVGRATGRHRAFLRAVRLRFLMIGRIARSFLCALILWCGINRALIFDVQCDVGPCCYLAHLILKKTQQLRAYGIAHRRLDGLVCASPRLCVRFEWILGQDKSEESHAMKQDQARKLQSRVCAISGCDSHAGWEDCLLCQRYSQTPGCRGKLRFIHFGQEGLGVSLSLSALISSPPFSPRPSSVPSSLQETRLSSRVCPTLKLVQYVATRAAVISHLTSYIGPYRASSTQSAAYGSL